MKITFSREKMGENTFNKLKIIIKKKVFYSK